MPQLATILSEMSEAGHGGPRPRGPLPVGVEAPDFALAQGGGPPLRLRDFRGEPVILAFASHWDPGAAEQIACYNRVTSELPAQQPRLIGLVRDGSWYNLQFDADRVWLPVLADLSDSEGMAVATRYGVQDGAGLFVIDAKGIICWRHAGPAGSRPQTDDIRDALQTLARHAQSDANCLQVTRREFIATAFGLALALSARPLPAAAPSRRSAEAAPVTLLLTSPTALSRKD